MAFRVTSRAFKKIGQLTKKINCDGFIFSASSGGCNGFNYDLKPAFKIDINELKNPQVIKSDDSKTKIYLDPHSELYLLGTEIDYQKEDPINQIYESKFIFNPDKKLAVTCGCGTSFSPRHESF